MEPITTAIIAALAKLAEPAVKDAYDGLKTLLINKFGKNSELVEAVEKVEAKPDSLGRQTMLQEEVLVAKVEQDPEILKAAEVLIEQIKAQPGGQQVTHNVTQTVTGSQNTFSGTGNVSVQRNLLGG